MEIVLIRHGQPEWVKGGEYTVDPGLTEIGKEQAEKSASVFAANSIDEIWVSPLSRAQETLKPFEEKISHLILKPLNGCVKRLMMMKKN